MPATRQETWALLPLSPAFCLFLGPNNQDPSIRSFSQPCPGIQKKDLKIDEEGMGKGTRKILPQHSYTRRHMIVPATYGNGEESDVQS